MISECPSGWGIPSMLESSDIRVPPVLPAACREPCRASSPPGSAGFSLLQRQRDCRRRTFPPPEKAVRAWPQRNAAFARPSTGCGENHSENDTPPSAVTVSALFGAGPEMRQHMQPDGRGEAGLRVAGGVDLGGERVERAALVPRDLAEGLPERLFERHAGAVPLEGERALDGPRAHGRRWWGALPPSPQAAIPPGYLSQDEPRISPPRGGAGRGCAAPVRLASLQGFSAPWSARSAWRSHRRGPCRQPAPFACAPGSD